MKNIIFVTLFAALMSGCATTYETANGPLTCPFFGSDDPVVNAECVRLLNAEMWEGVPKADQYEQADAYARSMAQGSNRACLVYAHHARKMLGRGTLLRSTRNGEGHASLVLDGGVVLDINEGVTTVSQICRTINCISGMNSIYAGAKR